MSFRDEPNGTALVVYDDGSAIIHDDNVDEDTLAIELRRFGVEDEAADGIGRILFDQELRCVGPDYPYTIVEGKTMAGVSFEKLAEAVTSWN